MRHNVGVQSIDFYQKHLNQVSRSFAFCIARLEEPLRRWVSSSYLICRLLDTVEDAPWNDKRCQKDQFEQFNRFLNESPQELHSRNWQLQFPDAIPEGEKKLIQDARMIFFDYHQFPELVKESIGKMVKSMSRGMAYFSQRSEIRVSQLKELNQYCFFVAGVVGEILTKLIQVKSPDWKLNPSHWVDAYHFGLFLQKINLLKDQLVDEKEGRFFIYNREEVRQSLVGNLSGAKRYLDSIPKKQKGYRLFCAWSLYLGVASLPYMEKSFCNKKNFKIPRIRTIQLVSAIERSLDDATQLDRLFLDLMGQTGLTFTDMPFKPPLSCRVGDIEEWFKSAYGDGELDQNGLAQLGVVV